MNVNYRNPEDGDVASMEKLSQALVEELHQVFDEKRFMDMITRVMGDPEQRRGAFIAEDEETRQVLGMVIGVARPARGGKREGFLQNIVVTPGARGMGVGKELVHRALERLKTLDVPTINVNIRDSQPQAITMYERLGFVRIGDKMRVKV
ncbi:MAG: GNAT family N-acetyltransferase [Candidatus Lokiarchaeota archaeon]|nr:GNAT family N-acetyltransferase [Candidatus Lokiarchaeota archaeon]